MWEYQGDFNYTGPSSLVFDGQVHVNGSFYYKATSSNPVTFYYRSFLTITGDAVFDDATVWSIYMTPTQARDLWSHRADRNISYIQANSLRYNATNVRTDASDSCTVISGVVKTLAVQSGGRPVQLLIVEFTTFKSFATCKVWWVIPLVIGIVVSIIGISLGCYFYGRNKRAEEAGYIPVMVPPNTMIDDEATNGHHNYGTIVEEELPQSIQ